MAEEARPHYFTVAEARALVPRLRGLLTAMQVEKQELDREVRALQRLTPAMRGNGHGAEAARREERIAELTAMLQQQLQQLADQGIEVKDLDLGLIDFPSLRDGRVVYLCWRVDEPTVAYWHETDAGYAGRQPLDE
ncbi:MAG: DUF2203 domain-containing protein [Sphaerobacter sp.]|nr:DUF2203 domain-containing protein [Sphaerobacter sp.]